LVYFFDFVLGHHQALRNDPGRSPFRVPFLEVVERVLEPLAKNEIVLGVD
jgi:hypothetical protein